MDTVLVLGARRNQLPMIAAAREMGLRVVAIDNQPQAVGLALADEAHTFDLADVERCFEVARRASARGVVTAAADYPVPTLAALCEALGLSGLSRDAARCATNKKAMRQRLAAAGVPGPASLPAATLEDAQAARRALRGDTIFKPALSQGGRGITQVAADAPSELVAEAFQRAAAATRGDGVLIEEFVAGPEFSVETITCGGKTTVVAVTDKQTSGTPYWVETGHSQPSQAAAADIEALRAAAIAAIAALGIDNAAGHTEARLTAHGPKIMEVGARLGGGSITSHLVPLSTGVNMNHAALQVALGRQPDLLSTRQRGAAMQFLLPPPGVVRHIAGVEAVRQMPGVVELQIDVEPGQLVRPLLDASCRVGYVICEAADAATALGCAAAAIRGITFEVA